MSEPSLEQQQAAWQRMVDTRDPDLLTDVTEPRPGVPMTAAMWRHNLALAGAQDALAGALIRDTRASKAAWAAAAAEESPLTKGEIADLLGMSRQGVRDMLRSVS